MSLGEGFISRAVVPYVYQLYMNFVFTVIAYILALSDATSSALTAFT